MEIRKKNIVFILLCFFLLAGLIYTYSNHFNNPFHFDDEHTIVNNAWIRKIGNIPVFFIDAKTTSSLPTNQSYRPGVTTLNTIDYALARNNPFSVKKIKLYGEDGLNPFYFHLSIFMAFILQAFLMFLLFRKILNVSCRHRWNDYFALFIVSFYCFHTATAETINYIISRSDSFSTLMVVLALVIYMYFPKKRKYHFYLLPFIIGFFVKEPALIFIPLLFVYVLLFEQNADLTKIFQKESGKKITASLRTVIIPLSVALFLVFLSRNFYSETNVYGTISRWHYFITQPFVITQYFKTFILPTELSADTDWTYLTSPVSIKFLFGLMFLTGMIMLAIRTSKERQLRPVSFGIIWFFLALLPTSSIVPLAEVLNDHRIFFPYVGLSLGILWLLIYLIIIRREQKYMMSPLRYLVPVVALFIIAVHAYGTRQRNKVWSSEESLWYDVTVKSPANGRGLMNYGLTQMKKGNYFNAKKYFERALIYTPDYSLLHINMGILLSAMNDDYSAEQHFKKAIALNTFLYQGTYYYGQFLKHQKRYLPAIEMLKSSVDLNPAYIEARKELMSLYFETEDWGALDLLAKETLKYIPDDPECMAYIIACKNKKTKLEIAKELVLQNPTADNYLDLSLKYYESEKYPECIDACREALKIKPDYAAAYNNICSAYNQMKEYEKAIQACNKALELQPDFELAKNNLKLARNNRK